MVKPHWPLAAVNEGGWTYIRREGDVHEELFHVREDTKESHEPCRQPGRTARARADAQVTERTHGRPAHAATVSAVRRPPSLPCANERALRSGPSRGR